MQIDRVRADDLAVVDIQHHPQRTGGGQRRAVLQGEGVVARTEEAVAHAGPCGVHDALTAAGRSHKANVDARQREKKTARHHRVVACAQGDRVALAALLHGDKERGRAHAALHVAVRRAHDEGFTVLPVHGNASGIAENERNSTGLNEESISQFAFLDKSRHMD